MQLCHVVYLAIVFYSFWCHRYVSAQYVLTRVYVRVFGEPPTPKHGQTHTCTCIRYEQMEALHIWDPCAVGPQAFQSASAFNANIGAWNTARATTLAYVRAFSAVACNAAKSCARSGYKWLCTHVEIEM